MSVFENMLRNWIQIIDDQNDITIENSGIFVSDADCPDKTCVKSGKLSNENFPIICMPHRLVIRFSEQGERNENKTTD